MFAYLKPNDLQFVDEAVQGGNECLHYCTCAKRVCDRESEHGVYVSNSSVMYVKQGSNIKLLCLNWY